MYDAIETILYKDHAIQILPDLDPFNPRTDTDETSVLYARGLSEEGPAERPNDRTHITLPVYRYSHGNIALNTTGFSCPWDSGLTGYISISKATAREEYGVKRISPQLRKRIEGRLQTEVAVYGAYCNGDVFGYQVTDPDGEEIDSCWGFFGFMEIDWDYMIEQAKGALA
jgi:hypothetical protein